MLCYLQLVASHETASTITQNEKYKNWAQLVMFLTDLLWADKAFQMSYKAYTFRITEKRFTRMGQLCINAMCIGCET